jgi:hypothetical protein
MDGIDDAIRDAWRKEAERRPEPVEPTPEEIASMTAAIRASWSPEERSKRLRVDWRPQPVNLPTGTDDELREAWMLT